MHKKIFYRAGGLTGTIGILLKAKKQGIIAAEWLFRNTAP
jgi:hypothetical protein